MAAAPGDELAAEKIEALAAALAAVEHTPKEVPDDMVQMGEQHTYHEISYLRYAGALGQMPGAEAALRAVTPRLRGDAKAAVLIARGRRGDLTARAGLREVLGGRASGLLRARAADSLGRVGTVDDLPLLRQLAQSDPLVRVRYLGVGPKPSERYYPVREAAKRALREIQATPKKQ